MIEWKSVGVGLVVEIGTKRQRQATQRADLQIWLYAFRKPMFPLQESYLWEMEVQEELLDFYLSFSA